MTGSGFRAGGKLLILVLQVLSVRGDVGGIVDRQSSSIMMALKDVFSLYHNNSARAKDLSVVNPSRGMALPDLLTSGQVAARTLPGQLIHTAWLFCSLYLQEYTFGPSSLVCSFSYFVQLCSTSDCRVVSVLATLSHDLHMTFQDPCHRDRCDANRRARRQATIEPSRCSARYTWLRFFPLCLHSKATHSFA